MFLDILYIYNYITNKVVNKTKKLISAIFLLIYISLILVINYYSKY
jgi:hypothetical protein